jgi:hypothetical protein
MYIKVRLVQNGTYRACPRLVQNGTYRACPRLVQNGTYRACPRLVQNGTYRAFLGRTDAHEDACPLFRMSRNLAESV